MGKVTDVTNILTTGGLYTTEIRNQIIDNICQVFYCEPDDIDGLEPVQAGMTNIVLSFHYNGGKFIYRHPGLGSEILVDRGRETIMQKVVEEAGIDTTLVAMDVEEGWKIARYIEHYDFDYHNLNDMVRGVMLIRQLHEAPCRVRWNFDVIRKAEGIKARTDPAFYGQFEDFNTIRDSVYRLYHLSKTDGIRLCYTHGDARDVNFLINKDEIYLSDWEYGGYGDPGFDLGSYIAGGSHSVEDVERILFTYYRHSPSPEQRRHFYGYIAISGWFYMHWSMLKESKGQNPEPHKSRWFAYARDYSRMALEMYKAQSVDIASFPGYEGDLILKDTRTGVSVAPAVETMMVEKEE